MRTLWKNKSFLFLAGLYFFFCICTSLIHPVTTIYVNSLSLPNSYFGFFYAAMSLGQVVGAIFWGFLSDKIGRKIPLIVGILGYAGSQSLFGFVNTIAPLIILFRFLSGFFVSAPLVLFLSITLDDVGFDERTNALSFMSAMNILGGSLAYEIGGALYDYAKLTIPVLFLVQIGCTVLAGLLAFLLRSKGSGETAPFETKETKTRISFRGLSPIILVLLFGIFLMNVGEGNVSNYLDVLVIDLGYQASTLGHFVLATGIVGLLANLFLVPLVKRIKVKNEMIWIIALLILAARCVLLEFHLQGNLLVYLYSIHMVYMLCRSTVTPFEQNCVARFSSEKTKGSIMGVRQMIVSLASVLGPLIGSAIYQTGSSLIMDVSAAFIFGACLVFFPLLFRKSRKRETKENNPSK